MYYKNFNTHVLGWSKLGRSFHRMGALGGGEADNNGGDDNDGCSKGGEGVKKM